MFNDCLPPNLTYLYSWSGILNNTTQILFGVGCFNTSQLWHLNDVLNPNLKVWFYNISNDLSSSIRQFTKLINNS